MTSHLRAQPGRPAARPGAAQAVTGTCADGAQLDTDPVPTEIFGVLVSEFVDG